MLYLPNCPNLSQLEHPDDCHCGRLLGCLVSRLSVVPPERLAGWADLLADLLRLCHLPTDTLLTGIDTLGDDLASAERLEKQLASQADDLARVAAPRRRRP
jgi:hypothetical protein